MFKKIILTIFAVSSSAIAQLDTKCAIVNLLNQNDFASIEAKIKGAENHNLLNQYFEEFCTQFGKKITPDNFEQAITSFELFLKLGALPQSNATAHYDYDIEPIMLVIHHMNWVFKDKENLLYESKDYHSDPFSIADPIRTIATDNPYRTKIIDQTSRLITLLVAAGADPNYGENLEDFEDGISPLCYAAAFDAPELVACLLKLGARANDLNEIFLEIDSHLYTEEHIEKVRNEYLKSNIDLNKLINRYSYTAFYIQHKVLSPTLITLLKHYQRHYESSNDAKRTAYANKIAALKIRKTRCEKMLKLLKAYGADDSLFNDTDLLFGDSAQQSISKKGSRDYFHYAKAWKKSETLDLDATFDAAYGYCFN